MQEQSIDFRNIVKNIENHKIVLPDFQREFVWKDESMQKQLVASVFAKMPIGSVLLLKSSPKEFASKNIGSKIATNCDDLANEVEYLLDGQQRITVLANVFSNIIFEQTPKVSDLNSPSLKRRFFLKIPHWKSIYGDEDYNDILGVKNFTNPQDSYGNVNFLTNDILPYIETKSFNTTDDVPYNPNHEMDGNLDSYCTGYKKHYLIPLYIFIPTSNNEQKVSNRKKRIINSIGEKIVVEIIDYYTSLDENREIAKQEKLLNDLLDKEDIKILNNKNNKEDVLSFIEEKLNDKRDFWTDKLQEYINSCLSKMSLNEIIVTAEQRARAIDIYENLNRGGISLSTFDLVMARVAIVSKENFYKRIDKNINSKKLYEMSLIPENIRNAYNSKYGEGGYNAAVNTNCCSSEKNKIEKVYLDVFLDVLSLYCNNKNYDCEKYNLDFIKRSKILQLDPDDINNNCEKICTSIDRGIFFFQTRCGIRNLHEINCSLMLVLVATIFTCDKYYNDVNVHKKLEAWYWASIFSGEFDKDQNTRLISNLKSFLSMLSGGSYEWILKLNENVLNTNNYSDEKLLLMEKVTEDRYPKQILRNYISQYFLAKTYPGMFDSNMTVSVFSDLAETLELHHIIPLGSVNDISESTSTLRNNKEHICNSPLNFVYIAKKDNNKISSKNLNDYAKIITVNAKSSLMINNYGDAHSASEDKDIKRILKTRFEYLRGDIQNHVRCLLGY